MNDQPIEVLRSLGAELQRVAEEDPAPRRLARRRRRMGGLAAAFVLLAAGGATAAVTGVFTPQKEVDGLVRTAPKSVVTTGTTSDGRRWELTTSDSDVGFCFGLRFPDEAGASSEGCGGSGPGSLTVATSSGGSAKLNALVFGTAPDAARRIVVRTAGRERTVPAVDDARGVEGRFYLAELPVHRLGGVTVVGLDAAGQRIATERIRRR